MLFILQHIYMFRLMPACLHAYTYIYSHKCEHLTMHVSINTYLNNYTDSGIIAYTHTYTWNLTTIHIHMHTYKYDVHILTCVDLLHRGVFWDNKVSCSCSGCWFFNDRANYQLNFIYFYWASQLLWSSGDGLTVCHMSCSRYGLYLYGLHPA